MNQNDADFVVHNITGNVSEKILADAVEKLRGMGPDEVIASVKAGGASVIIARDKTRINVCLAIIEYAGRKYFVGI